MSGPKWDDTEEIVPKWEDTHDVRPISLADASDRAIANGGTLGLSDELGGLQQAAMDKIHGLFGDSVTDVNKKLAEQGFKGDIGPTNSHDLYRSAQQENEQLDNAAAAQHPGVYNTLNVVSSIVPSMLIPGASASLGARALGNAGLGAIQGFGNSKGNLENGNVLGDIGIGAGLGSAASVLGDKVVPYVTDKAKSAVGSIAEGLAPMFKNPAKKLAENATGATGMQVFNKFDENAGEHLLDNGLIRFGDNASNIAKRVGAAKQESGRAIGEAIKQLDEQGAKVDVQSILDTLGQKEKEYRSVGATQNVADDIKRVMNDIKNSQGKGKIDIPGEFVDVPDSLTGGLTKQQLPGRKIDAPLEDINLRQSELEKQGFGKKVKDWTKPESQPANKEAYDAFMNASEDAARNTNPELLDIFKQDKKNFGILAPIEEAASKRAATLNQSPWGGLLDTAAFGAGGAALGGLSSGDDSGAGLGALAGVIGRKTLAPRITSSVAVGMDKIGNLIKSSPQAFGKFANVLQNAAQRGSQALGATHFLLQQQNPEYQQLMKNIRDGE